MVTTKDEFVVSPMQVLAARAFLRRNLDLSLVTDRILEVAHMDLDEVQARWDALGITEEKIHAAQIAIDIAGGEAHVSPGIVAMAHATAPTR